MDKTIAVEMILSELSFATSKFGKFNSTHEGYAVILEELDELWEQIKLNGTQAELAKEATQVTAMGLRFLMDLC